MAALCRSLIMAVAMLILAGTHARAQVIQNLATGGSAGLGGLTFTISGCGSSSTAGLCNNVMLELTESRGYITAEFLGNGGAYGSNVLAVSDGSLQYFWFTLTVTSSSRALTTLSGAVTGTGINDTQITNGSGCSVSGGWNTGVNCGASAYTNAPTETSFSGMTNLNISYTLGLQGSTGQSLVLNNATSTFGAVPEPSGAMAMVPGLATLYWLRRRGPRRVRRTARTGIEGVSRGIVLTTG